MPAPESNMPHPAPKDTAVVRQLAVGRAAPAFSLECVDAENPTPRHVQISDFAGKWLLLIFYPRDFSFVSPTELTAFSARIDDFKFRDCQILGISVDSIELHREWLTTPGSDGGVGALRFPLVSDPQGEMSQAYGVWVADKEVSTRGMFIIDPKGLLQFSAIHNLRVGRGVDEVLRVLDALRTGGLCPAGWTNVDGTIDVERSLKPGCVLGHYRIRESLGARTFGSVFSAWDLRLERVVILKILKLNVLVSREKLLREARAIARVNHPNICTIFAVEEEDGLLFLVMEYMEGSSLSDLVVDGMTRSSVRSIAAQIAAGLAAAHEQKVVHGDLKPANIIVAADGTAKILDFGMARLQPVTGSAPKNDTSDTPSAASGPGHSLAKDDPYSTVDIPAESFSSNVDKTILDEDIGIRGTPAYMSPEQAIGQPAVLSSDSFSFALILYEMLVGQRALSDESLVEILSKLSSNNLARELTAHVDDEYRVLLASLLERDPAQRPLISDVAAKLVAE